PVHERGYLRQNPRWHADESPWKRSTCCRCWPYPVRRYLRFTRTGRLASWGSGDCSSWPDDAPACWRHRAADRETEPHQFGATVEQRPLWPEPGTVFAPLLGYDEMRRPGARRGAPAVARDRAVPRSAGARGTGGGNA